MTFVSPRVIFLDKIWDQSPHNALTDLIYFQNKWFCTFRESDSHQKGIDGTIRIISSDDAKVWHSIAFFEEKDIDLRDPKLSITPDNRLMLLVERVILSPERKYVVRQPQVTFSLDGRRWEPFKLILEPHEWLWRVTWHEGKAYGVSYRYKQRMNRKGEWVVNLFESNDGINYKSIVPWNIRGNPNETTLRFLKSGEMVALVRRDKPQHNHAWIGISNSPYKEWRWKETSHYFGGPNFLILDNETMIAAGRMCAINPYGIHERTVLAEMELDQLTPLLLFPSGGDTSYPGMVYHDELLWISYYSSHEGTTSIYLACLDLG